MTVVRDQHIEIAIVVDIANREPTADLFKRQSGPRLAGNLGEFAATLVAKEQITLRVRNIVTKAYGIVHHVAVGNDQVQIAIVVVVEECRAEADEFQARLGQAGFDRDIGEIAVSLLKVHKLNLKRN